MSQGFTDMARDFYDRVNKALKHGRLGSLPEPVERTARHYMYALGPIAKLVKGVSARTRSVMELEGHQLLEDALSELLSAAIHHVPGFPAEFVVRADVPSGQFETYGRAKRLAAEFAKSFARSEE